MNFHGRNSRRCGAAFAWIVLMVIMAATTAVAAGPYERPADRSVAAALPPELAKGQYHRVLDPIVADGYMLHFTVKSDFGTFEVTGYGALRKLVHEIQAIAELQKVKKSKAFAKGLAGAVKAPLSLTKSLITHPVDTIAGVPKGAYQIVENVGTSATTTRDPSEDSKLAQALKMSSFKREYAAQLDVDPYSSNKVLQKELNSVAWAATAGDWAFSVAMLPAGAGGSAVSNIRLANSLKNALKEEPPGRLRIINNEKLQKMGIPEDLRKRFLDHPAFTPWHDTIIAANLEQMGGVAGRDAFLNLALRAEDETQANFYMNMAQTMRGYHETVSPLTEIGQVAGLIVAQSKGGTVLVPFPLDYGVWTERADRLSDEIKAKYSAQGSNRKLDFWVMGGISPQAKQQFAGKGITVGEQINRRIEIID